MRIFTAVVVFLFLFSGLAVAGPHDCAGAVAARMAQFKVSPDQIVRTVFVDVRDAGCCDFLVGYEAWVDLKQCRGSVVMIGIDGLNESIRRRFPFPFVAGIVIFDDDTKHCLSP